MGGCGVAQGAQSGALDDLGGGVGAGEGATGGRGCLYNHG